MDDERVYCAADEYFGAGRKMRFAVKRKTYSFSYICYSYERFSAGDERVESARSNLRPTQLHI